MSETPDSDQQKEINHMIQPYLDIQKEKEEWLKKRKEEEIKKIEEYNTCQEEFISQVKMDEIFRVRFPKMFNLPDDPKKRIEDIDNITSSYNWMNFYVCDVYKFSGTSIKRIDYMLTHMFFQKITALKEERANLEKELTKEKIIAEYEADKRGKKRPLENPNDQSP
jgi:hypothetical protein